MKFGDDHLALVEMAAFKVLLFVTLALSAQWLVEARSVKSTRGFDEDFKAMLVELDDVVSGQVATAMDVLVPVKEQISEAAKEDLVKAIQELDATEKNALVEVDKAVEGAVGNVEECVDDDKQKMKDLSEQTRRSTEDCVGETIHILEQTYESAVNAIDELKVLGSLYTVLYESCDIDDCKEIVIGMFRDEIDVIPEFATLVTKTTAEQMVGTISNVEEVCFQKNHQSLRVELREIVDRIEKCLASN